MEISSDLLDPIYYMQSEENVALLEKQKQCLLALEEKHANIMERAQELYEVDPESEELEQLKEVR